MSNANETKLDSADLGEMHIVATRAMHAGFKLVAIDTAHLCEVLDVALLVANIRERLDELIDTWRHRAAVLREEGERAEASGFTSCADALELVVSASAKG